MARDRIYINSSYRAVIDDLKNNKILGFEDVENKDSFLLAVALGVDSPEDVKNKDGWVRTSYLKTTDKALMASVLLGISENDEVVDNNSDIDKAIEYCEKCAESGYRKLYQKINDFGRDNEIVQKKMLKELDSMYLSIVESDI